MTCIGLDFSAINSTFDREYDWRLLWTDACARPPPVARQEGEAIQREDIHHFPKTRAKPEDIHLSARRTLESEARGHPSFCQADAGWMSSFRPLGRMSTFRVDVLLPPFRVDVPVPPFFPLVLEKSSRCL